MLETLTLVHDQGRTYVRNAKPRRLGVLFPLARRLYLFAIPICLLLSGSFCVLLRSDATMVFGGFVATAVSIYLAVDILMRSAPLRFSTVLAFTLGLGYGLGALNTWFTLPRGNQTVGDFLGLSTPWLSEAMGGLLLTMGLLLALGELYEKPIFGEEFRLKFDNRAITLMTLGTLFRAAMIVSGRGGGFGDMSVVATGHVSVLAQLAGDLQNPLFALALCAALNAHGRFLRLYLWGMTGVLFLTAFPEGRRALIYSVLLGTIALRFGDYRIPLSPLKKIILAGIAGLVLYAATIGFFYFRIAGYSLLNPTFSQRISAVVELAETKKYSEIKAAFSHNVEGRTFIIGFLSEVVGYSNTLPGAHGSDLLSQFELAVPSVFYPGKDVYFTEEQLASSLFGQGWGDQANSVLTAGAVDFGFLGLLIYPLLAVLMLRVFIEICATSLQPFAACFIVFLVLGSLLEPETTLTSYFLAIRESLLVGIAVSLAQYAPDFRLRRAAV